jgi:V8-like Glu-specific endopeptidase
MAHSFADVKGKMIEVAGYPEKVCEKVEKNFLFRDEGDVKENGGPKNNIAFVTANASKGQDGSPAIMNNQLVGLFSGINTEEEDSEEIIVNLITPEVVQWINTIETN